MQDRKLKRWGIIIAVFTLGAALIVWLLVWLLGSTQQQETRKKTGEHNCCKCETKKSVPKRHALPKKKAKPAPSAPAKPAPPEPEKVLAKATPPPAPEPEKEIIVRTRVKTRVVYEDPVEEAPTYERRRSYARPRVVYNDDYYYEGPVRHVRVMPPPPPIIVHEMGWYREDSGYGQYPANVYNGGGQTYNPVTRGGYSGGPYTVGTPGGASRGGGPYTVGTPGSIGSGRGGNVYSGRGVRR